MEFNKEEVLDEYILYIKNLPSGLEKMVKNIEDENYEKVNAQITLFVEGMQWLLSASKYLASQDIIANDSFEQLNTHLEILLEGLEKNDYVLMSDIIEYELIPYFENSKVEN